MPRRILRPILPAVLLALVFACEDKDNQGPAGTTTYKATLTGSAEVPAVITNGSGNATVTVDASKNLTYTVTFANLGSGVLSAHIHGPAAPGASAGVIVPLTVTVGQTAGTLGPLSVALSTSLTGAINADSLVKLMNAGQTYVNVHTTNNQGGEIRGWLVKQ